LRVGRHGQADDKQNEACNKETRGLHEGQC
jgi:hypothetical protein